MKINDTATIIPSVALNQLKLGDLVGRQCKIVEIHTLSHGRISGAWVALEGGAYLDETEWYIPEISLMI